VAINLGALELSISTRGTQAALRDVATVDKAAAGAAQRGVAGINAVGAAATKQSKGVSAFASSLKGTFALLGVTLGSAAVVAGVRAMNSAMDAQEQSVRKLASTAKITGVPLATLNRLASEGESKFRLSAVMANEFAIEIAKLTSKAGDIGLASEAMGNFLNLGAARGFSPAATLQAVQQAILGIDEGTDKLFGANPSVLYAQYAAAIGTSVGKLNDQQKAMALVAAAQKDGSKVQGELAAFYETAAGKAYLLEQAQTKVALAFGTAIAPMREVVTEHLTNFAEWITANQGSIIALAGAVSAVLVPAFQMFGTYMVSMVDTLTVAWGGFISFVARTSQNALNFQADMLDFIGMDEEAGKRRARASQEGALADSMERAAADADARFKKRHGSFSDVKGGSATTAPRADFSNVTGATGTEARTTAAAARAAAAAGRTGATGTPAGRQIGQSQIGAATWQSASLGGIAALNSAPISSSPIRGVTADASGSAGFQNAIAGIGAQLALIDTLKAEADAKFADFGQGMGDVLATSLGTAFSDGIGAAGDVLLSGLGGMLVEMGKAMLVQGATMVGLLPALSNPFTSGPALLAAGAVLVGLGATLAGIAGGGSRGGRGGGRGGGGSGPASFADRTESFALGSGQTAPTRTGADAKAATLQPITNNITLIGPNDPSAQRAMNDLIQNGQRRGLPMGAPG
jgi:hypothetical protein